MCDLGLSLRAGGGAAAARRLRRAAQASFFLPKPLNGEKPFFVLGAASATGLTSSAAVSTIFSASLRTDDSAAAAFGVESARTSSFELVLVELLARLVVFRVLREDLIHRMALRGLDRADDADRLVHLRRRTS